MTALKYSLAGALAALALSGVAQAQERPLGLTFNVGAASDYVFRGVSQTDEEPQVFGGADVTLGSIGYAGVWATNVDFGDGTDVEYDLYAGIKPALGPVTLDLGVIYYGYHNQPGDADWDFTELKVAGSMPVGPATIGAAVFYSNDFTGGVGPSAYYEANASVAIPDTRFTLSGALGRQTLQDVGDADYTVWNLGAGIALNEKLGLDVRYWGTDADQWGAIYDDRFVVGFKVTF
jgi:uncharacterized protein (TIGR02001 family)